MSQTPTCNSIETWLCYAEAVLRVHDVAEHKQKTDLHLRLTTRLPDREYRKIHPLNFVVVNMSVTIIGADK